MSSREKLILERLNRADSRLQAQQQIAIAADARAMQLVAVLIASAALTMAINGNSNGFWHVKLAIVVPLIIAAVCGIYAARPVAWHAPGMQPSAFDGDLAHNRDYLEVVLELSGHLEVGITKNNEILECNADALRLAAYLAISAPVLGGVAAFAI